MNNQSLTYYSLMNKCLDDLHWQLTKQIEEALLLGLERKGYTFKDLKQRERFTNAHCRCVDDKETKERVYHVHGKPFLIWNYEMKIDLDMEGPKITASFGAFRFV